MLDIAFIRQNTDLVRAAAKNKRCDVDIDALLDADKQLIPTLNAARVATLRADGVIGGGMIPKVDACLRAAELGTAAHMANGLRSGALRALVEGATLGTLVEA